MISNKKLIEETIQKIYLTQFNLMFNNYFELIKTAVQNIEELIGGYNKIMKKVILDFMVMDKNNLSNISNQYVYLFNDYCMHNLHLSNNFNVILNANVKYVDNIYTTFVTRVINSDELRNISNLDENYILSTIKEKYIKYRIDNITEYYNKLVQDFKENLIRFAKSINLIVLNYNMLSYYKIDHPRIKQFL
jgi:hypothetical protein